jgi:hypothetical protein
VNGIASRLRLKRADEEAHEAPYQPISGPELCNSQPHSLTPNLRDRVGTPSDARNSITKTLKRRKCGLLIEVRRARWCGATMEQCRNEPSLFRCKPDGLAYGKDESRPRYATPTGLHPPAQGCRTRLPWVDQCKGVNQHYSDATPTGCIPSVWLPYSATLGGAARE